MRRLRAFARSCSSSAARRQAVRHRLRDVDADHLLQRRPRHKAGGDPDNFPATWDGIIDLAQKIEALGGGKVRGCPFDWQITGNWMWQALVFSHGGTMLSADEKKVAFDGPRRTEGHRVLGRLVTTATCRIRRQAEARGLHRRQAGHAVGFVLADQPRHNARSATRSAVERRASRPGADGRLPTGGPPP